MSTKTSVWIGMFIGSTVGSYIPSLWGDGMFSFSGIILSGAGALAGVYIGFKLGSD